MLRAISTAVVLCAFLSSSYLLLSKLTSEPLPNYGGLKSFELKSDTGESFNNKNFLGKVSVLYFMFTSCKGPCPLNTKEAVSLLNNHRSENNLQLVSISVDPEVDTPEVLNAYKKKHSPNETRWTLLHGATDRVKKISNQIFNLSLEDNPDSHSPRFVVIDEDGEVRALIHKENLAETVEKLL